MRIAWQVVAWVCVIHVLAALGVVAWLGASGRLSRSRVAEAVEVFEPTVAEQRAREKAAEEQAAREGAKARREAVLAGAGEGGGSIADEMKRRRESGELAMGRMERTRAEVENLRRGLQLAQQRIEEQRDTLAEREKTLQKRLDRIEKSGNDEGFKKAVRLYESLPADQVKRMFMAMVDEQRTEQVVRYLEAMQPRQAGKVLEEFQTPRELDRAVELTRRLRERGSELVRDLEGVG